MSNSKYPLDKPAEQLIIRAIASDGGTAYAEAIVEGVDGWQFYIDGRIGSTTSGELFSDYPSEESIKLESTSIFVRSIKEKWLNFDYES